MDWLSIIVAILVFVLPAIFEGDKKKKQRRKKKAVPYPVETSGPDGMSGQDAVEGYGDADGEGRVAASERETVAGYGEVGRGGRGSDAGGRTVSGYGEAERDGRGAAGRRMVAGYGDADADGRGTIYDNGTDAETVAGYGMEETGTGNVNGPWAGSTGRAGSPAGSGNAVLGNGTVSGRAYDSGTGTGTGTAPRRKRRIKGRDLVVHYELMKPKWSSSPDEFTQKF